MCVRLLFIGVPFVVAVVAAVVSTISTKHIFHFLNNLISEMKHLIARRKMRWKNNAHTTNAVNARHLYANFVLIPIAARNWGTLFFILIIDLNICLKN